MLISETETTHYVALTVSNADRFSEMESRSPEQLVGDNVRQIRTARGVTLAQLSESVAAAGGRLSVAQLSKLETGGRGIPVSDLVVLATALGVSAGELLQHAPPTPVTSVQQVQFDLAQYRRFMESLTQAFEAFKQVEGRLLPAVANLASSLRERIERHPELRDQLTDDEVGLLDELLQTDFEITGEDSR